MMPAMNGAMPPANPLAGYTPEKMEEDKAIAEAVTWDEVSAILRSDDRRNYSIDIETDATAFEDSETEKHQANEFMATMGQWMQFAMPAMDAKPTLAPLIKELTMMFVGKFKPGRTLEESFEDAFNQIKQQPPQPNPEAMKMQGEMAMAEKTHQLEMQKMQGEVMAKQKEHEIKVQGLQADLAFKGQELEIKKAELSFKAQESAFNRQSQAEAAQFDRQSRMEEAAWKREEMAQSRQAAQEDRMAAAEDREFQRNLAIEDAHGKRQDRELKVYETQSRLALDQKAHEDNHELETDKVISAGGSTRKQIEDGVAQAIQTLAEQVAKAMSEVQNNQIEIASILSEIKTAQDEMEDAVTSAVDHMTAPRKVVRDGTGRAIGVERGKSENEGADLKTMIASLKSGRQIQRDKQGRVEGF